MLIAVACFSLCSCFSESGIAIVDVQKFSLKIPPGKIEASPYRQAIANLNVELGFFQTIQRLGESYNMPERKYLDRLKLIKYDLSCNILSSEIIPLLIDSYGMKNSYDFSPDGNWVVYYKDSDRSLHLCNVNAKTDKKVLNNISSIGYSIKFIKYLNNELVIISLSDDQEIGRNNNQIIKYNLLTKVQSILYQPDKISSSGFDYSLSPDKSKLAFWEGDKKHGLYGSYKILDIASGKILATIKSDNLSFTDKACWSPDGSKIAIICNDKILLYSLASDEKQTIKVLNKKYNYCCISNFLNDDTLIYSFRKSESKRQYFSILNIKTGEEKEFSRIGDISDCYVIKNGEQILCEFLH
jgi:hypothetical protein